MLPERNKYMSLFYPWDPWGLTLAVGGCRPKAKRFARFPRNVRLTAFGKAFEPLAQQSWGDQRGRYGFRQTKTGGWLRKNKTAGADRFFRPAALNLQLSAAMSDAVTSE